MWDLGKEILELRFKNGFLYWDHTGDIALKLCEAIPTLALENATPGQTNLLDEENQLRVRYSYNTINLSQDLFPPPSIKLFDMAEGLARMLIKNIGVKTLTRVGHRLTFHKKFPTEEKSHAYIVEMARKRGLGADLFAGRGWLGDKKISTFTVKYSDEKTGIRLELSSGKTDYAVTGPAATELKKHMPTVEFLAILDVDVFTTQSLLAEELAVDSLRSSNLKMIRTEVHPLFD